MNKTPTRPNDLTEPAAAGSCRARNRVVALFCLAFTLSMLGAAYAAVPLYDWFCRVTGFGGTTQVASALPAHIVDREITIRFDANTDRDLPWDFEPKVRSLTVKLGEVHQVNYAALNLDDGPTWATASYNVTPDLAGLYFNKITCFCFNEQKLGAGEQQDMPVLFFVDPQIVNDQEASLINTITLSYTFHRNEPPERASAALPTGEMPVIDEDRG